MQRRDALICIAERLQDLDRVLAHQRRRALDLAGRLREEDRMAELAHLAHLRVLDFHRKPVLPNLWIGENFVKRIDWRGGNVLFEQTAQPLLTPPPAKDGLQLLN